MSHARLYGSIGCLAALAAVVADLALQYTTNSAHLGALDYSYFLDVSQTRIQIGFYVGVIRSFLRLSASGTSPKDVFQLENASGCHSFFSQHV